MTLDKLIDLLNSEMPPCNCCGAIVASIPPDEVFNGTCGFCLSIGAKMDKDERIEELRQKRTWLLTELVKVDVEMRKVLGHSMQNEFTCACEAKFGTYFERQLHIDSFDNCDHRPLGERKRYFKCGKCIKQFDTQEHFDNHTCIPIIPTRRAMFGKAINIDDL